MTHTGSFPPDGESIIKNEDSFASTTIQDTTQLQNVTELQSSRRRSTAILSKSEEMICNFFVSQVANNSPECVLETFEALFFHQSCHSCEKVNQALYEILDLNQEAAFKSILIRSCYILVNNWSAQRQLVSISKLIQLFASFSETPQKTSMSLIKQRCKQWLFAFLQSKDYRLLTVFTSRYHCDKQSEKNPNQALTEVDLENSSRLSERYASYLLASQAQDPEKPLEQREAAKRLSQQLKENFKFELAMYTARSQSCSGNSSGRKNPTRLGDNVLQLIQKILGKGGKFSYINIANIFLKQTEGILFIDFKESLLKYLFYSFGDQDWVKPFKSKITQKVQSLYEDYDEQPWNANLLLRTCNRVIEYLTTENRRHPSDLFTVMMMQQQSLSLVIILLKLILISRNSYNHLEACIANLIEFYDGKETSDNRWLIEFLEALQVTLTIYSENVCYSLVNVSNAKSGQESDNSQSFRIFSISKPHSQLAEQIA
ncbi:MAG: hypothetical protein ACOC0N_02805 [Chroococcales cyanobacterium]